MARQKKLDEQKRSVDPDFVHKRSRFFRPAFLPVGGNKKFLQKKKNETRRRPTRHCSFSHTSHRIAHEQEPGGASNSNNVEIFIRRHGRINSWIAASAGTLLFPLCLSPTRDARSLSSFFDLFQIYSGIYLPVGCDVDLLSVEYSRALCAVSFAPSRRSIIRCSTFACGLLRLRLPRRNIDR